MIDVFGVSDRSGHGGVDFPRIGQNRHSRRERFSLRHKNLRDFVVDPAAGERIDPSPSGKFLFADRDLGVRFVELQFRPLVGDRFEQREVRRPVVGDRILFGRNHRRGNRRGIQLRNVGGQNAGRSVDRIPFRYVENEAVEIGIGGEGHTVGNARLSAGSEKERPEDQNQDANEKTLHFVSPPFSRFAFSTASSA